MPSPPTSTVTRKVTVNGTEFSADVMTVDGGRSMIVGHVTFRENGQLIKGPKVGSGSYATLQEADDAIRKIGGELRRNKAGQLPKPARVPIVWLAMLAAAAIAAAFFFLR